MKTLVFILSLFALPVFASEINEHTKACVQAFAPDYNKIASCQQTLVVALQEQKLSELRGFLKDHPEYKWPGGSAGMPHPLLKEVVKERHDINAIAYGQPTYDLKMLLTIKNAN